MTACVNNQNENKGGVSHKVLRSVVAGVMAVSMVPSVALADTVATESEVAPLANQQESDAFSAGTITKAVDGNGKELTIDKDGVITLTATGESLTPEGQTVIPTQLKLPNGTLVDLTEETVEGTCDYTTEYAEITAGVAGAYGDTEPANVGEYSVKVTSSEGYTNNYLKVKIVGASLKDAYVYAGSEVNDSEVVWSGAAANSYKFAIGDEDITAGIGTANFVVRGATYSGANPLPAGSYEVDITGADNTIYEGSKATIDFTVNKLDLNDLTFTANDIANVPAGSASVSATWLNDEGDSVVIPNGAVKYTVYNSLGEEVAATDLGKDNGDYTVKATPDEAYEDSVTGDAEGSFRVVTHLITDFKYNGTSITSGWETSFTEAQVAAKQGFAPSKITSESLPSTEKIDVVVEKDGKVVNSYDELGTYVVKANVETDAATYLYGGTCTFTFDVVKDAFTNVDTYVEFDGNIVGDTLTHTYDGTDVVKNASIVVKDSKGNELKAGTDYEVNWYKDATSGTAAVDTADEKTNEVVNAGDYLLEIKGITYSGYDVVTVTVSPCAPVAIRVAGLKTVYQSNGAGAYTAKTGIPYTGEEIVPTFEYTTDTQAKINDGTAEWKTLPVDAYTLEVQKGGNKVECKDAQEYHASILASDEDMAANFNLTSYASNFIGGSNNEGNFFVIDDTCFNDVKAADWYATAASTAAKLGYFTGVEGGLFVPAKSLTRAEAVQLLFAMSGEQIDWSNVAKYKQVAAEFGDVDVDAWYGVQLGWAKEAGLVSGDDQGNFNPSQEINREQFAVMLANYASKFGTYKAADGKVLADYADADSISSWAEDAVAWAVENKVMGANDTLTPQATISRAETATMVVNYQPTERA